MSEPILILDNVVAGYGKMTILNGTTARIRRGAITTVIGPNGAGKSTLFKTVFGLLPVRSGSITFDGRDITNFEPRAMLDAGVAYVPQGRNIFPELSVGHNLELGAVALKDQASVPARVDAIMQRFPMLRDKARAQASTLSGGQQKILEVARSLLLHPKLLLIDEPSIGLSPLMVQEVFDILKGLRDKGVSVLLIEQNAKQALQMSDYGLVLEQGQTRIEDTAPRILNDARIAQLFLGGGLEPVSMQRTLVGLIGANILKSLSPALHADAFAAAGIDGYYHLMDVEMLRGRSLPQLLDAVKTAGFAGTNVTFPFKQEVLKHLDALDEEARQIGALNCVTIAPDGATKGYNTDRSGFRRSFEHYLGRASADGARVTLVGAGGAGRAVAFALMDLGVADLAIHDSNDRQAASLIADLHKYFGAARASAVGDLAKAVADSDGVVNATPVGMLGIPGNPVPMEALTGSHWAADVIYTPLDTEFIKAARARGARTLTGGGMCVYQAVEAFRLFTGIAPDVARMHKTFLRALEARDAALAAQA